MRFPVAACAIVTVAACGGQLEKLGGDEDASADRSVPRPADGGTAAPEAGQSDDASVASGSLCPSVQPGNGDPCTLVDWQCEYGDAANPWCDFLDKCYGPYGGWSNQALPLELCGKGACPSSYADVVEGDACSVENLGCAYSEGQCDCGKTSDGGLVWTCFSPAGCPAIRPRIGSVCAEDGLYCDYGACAGGAAEQCVLKDGWMQVLPPSCK